MECSCVVVVECSVVLCSLMNRSEAIFEPVKLVRNAGVFNILTSNVYLFKLRTSNFDFEICFALQRMYFFNILTLKSGPKIMCFVYFDF